MFTLRRLPVFVALLLIAPSAFLLSQAPFSLAAHYDKHEYMIPMRDGVRLFTAVYTPKDTSKSYPFLINRTPVQFCTLR